MMEFIISMGDMNIEPCNGMEFESNEAAYSFYKEYAKCVGFGTAKLSSRRSRVSGEFIDAKFACMRYGSKQQSAEVINPRPSPKIGCKASMHVKRKQNGKWFVHSLVKEHNHELLPAQARFFRSHKTTGLVNKNYTRLRTCKIYAETSKHLGGCQHVDVLEIDGGDQFDKRLRLVLEVGDGQYMLDHLMNMQEENPKFFFAVDFNEEQCLRNVFWIDAKGRTDYVNFGDVVSFDTTYVKNKYKTPLALFVGVNNHFQSTLLGCALIADETVSTFVWLMKTWLKAVGGQAPGLILTDQDKAMKAAVAKVFPGTHHCFGLWHVLEKIPENLGHLTQQHENFTAKFYKCIKSLTDEQFEKRWWKIVDRFGLKADEWIQSLHEDRKRWVPTYMRGMFLGGMSTPHRFESINSSFDKYIYRDTRLREFFEQYKTILQDKYEEEAKADFDAWHESPELKSPSPFEKQLSAVYTHEIFEKFQVEVLGAAACHLKKLTEDGSDITFSVKDFEEHQNFIVTWNERKKDIFCSCLLFEYKGFLCRHAMVVFQMSGVFSIPSQYILKIWTKLAKSRHPISQRLDELQSRVQQYNDLCRRAIVLGEEGSLSQESYDVALCSLKEAMGQCVIVNKKPRTSITHLNIEEENPGNSTASKLNKLDPRVAKTKGALKRVEDGMEKINIQNSNKEVKVHLEPIAINDGMETNEVHLNDIVEAGIENSNNENTANDEILVHSGAEVIIVGRQGSFHPMVLMDVRCLLNGQFWRIPHDKSTAIKNINEEAQNVGHREARLLRYKEKRQKRIGYEAGKLNDEKRPRLEEEPTVRFIQAQNALPSNLPVKHLC